MGQPAAKQGDKIVGVDIHMVIIPGSLPLPLPHPFSGGLDSGLSRDVNIMGKAAAVVGSTASNSPAHIPTPPGIGFPQAPQNQATVLIGSSSVRINGKAAARNGDTAETCNDPANLPAGTIIAAGTVLVG